MARKDAKGSESSDDDDEASMEVLPPDWVGKNSCKKRGHAMLGPAIYESIGHGEQTLFVNAAVGCNEEGRMESPPWIIDLDLEHGEE